MRLQFVFNNDVSKTIDIDVTDVPTREEEKAIEDEIYSALNDYEENEDCEYADLYEICYNAVQKHMHIAENRVTVRTFYISGGYDIPLYRDWR